MSTTHLRFGQRCPRPYDAVLSPVRDGRHEPRLQLSFGEPVPHARPGERPYYHHFSNLLLTAAEARELAEALLTQAATLNDDADGFRIGGGAC